MTSHTTLRFLTLRTAALLALAALALAAGCSRSTPASPSSPAPAEPAGQQQTVPAEPVYSKWIVYINDDDSYTKGSITYSIALNLTATNPTSDKAGTYKGKATAATNEAPRSLSDQTAGP